MVRKYSLLLTLLHSERQKFHRVLAFLCAIGLKLHRVLAFLSAVGLREMDMLSGKATLLLSFLQTCI